MLCGKARQGSRPHCIGGLQGAHGCCSRTEQRSACVARQGSPRKLPSHAGSANTNPLRTVIRREAAHKAADSASSQATLGCMLLPTHSGLSSGGRLTTTQPCGSCSSMLRTCQMRQGDRCRVYSAAGSSLQQPPRPPACPASAPASHASRSTPYTMLPPLASRRSEKVLPTRMEILVGV